MLSQMVSMSLAAQTGPVLTIFFCFLDLDFVEFGLLLIVGVLVAMFWGSCISNIVLA
jgi:hypothetical protein